MNNLSIFIPMDRRQAMVHGRNLDTWARGSALFADISGFTPLTEALANELGPRRGAEELNRFLNQIFDALITELHRFGGSVIGFSGDAVTCWIDDDDGSRATACALAMQDVMKAFQEISTPTGTVYHLGIKVAVATGQVRRFLVGDPDIQVIDAIAGQTLDTLATAESLAQQGQVILDQNSLERVRNQVQVEKQIQDHKTGHRFTIVSQLKDEIDPAPWAPVEPEGIDPDLARTWLLPPVYERIRSGQGDFLAELRPAVSLFLKFTGINYDEDPDSGIKLDNFIRQAQNILNTYGGSLIQLTIGDKGSYIQAVFGTPIAHEDDALRAASAALELNRLTDLLPILETTQIGVAQGRMHAGAYGGKERMTYGVLSDEVNLAARLMSAANPGQILVCPITMDAIAEEFDLQPLPPINVKGKMVSIEIFSLVATKRRSAPGTDASKYALPLVGRQDELQRFEQLLKKASEGEGQIVSLTGEPGMGKSRLVAEFVKLAGQGDFICLAGECQSYGTHNSYLVWETIWQEFFQLNLNAPLEDQINQLTLQLENLDPVLLPRLPLLGAVLNLPIPDNELTGSLDAKLRKTSLEALLFDCVRARAEERPILFVLEDTHWMDPLSLDLLATISRSIGPLSVLILIAHRRDEDRKEAQPDYTDLPYFSHIPLSEFTAEEAQDLIANKLAQLFNIRSDTNADLIRKITERAEGNPFYIEELLNYLKDRGIDAKDMETLEEIELPSSLHSLILSRIDRLNENQKTVLKVSSVIGRLFNAAIVWGVYPQLGNKERIEQDLDYLRHLDLTHLDSPEPELTYLFKNLITQQVAYENLPYRTRAMLHAQIGAFLENATTQTDQVVDLLAYHYGMSENVDKKRQYLLLAAKSAQADYANSSAINYYQQVLPLISSEDKVEVMLDYASVLEVVGEWEAADELLQSALQLANEQNDPVGAAWSKAAFGEHMRKKGDFNAAETWLEDAKADFEELGNSHGRGQVLHRAGVVAGQKRDFEQALNLFQESLAIRQELGDTKQSAYILGNLGIIARLQSNYEEAHKYHQEGLNLRRQIGDRWGIANSLNNLGNVALDMGDSEQARSLLEEALGIQRELGDRWAIANALNNLANVYRSENDFSMALAYYEESLQINQELGDSWAIAYLLEDVGALAAKLGDLKEALMMVAAADTIRLSIDSPLSPAELEKLAAWIDPTESQLEEDTVIQARKHGQEMSSDQAVDFAIQWCISKE